MSPPLLIHKIGNFFVRKKLGFIAKIFSWCNRILFSVWMPSEVTIGRNFTLGYWGLGIVIHSNTVFGDNCHVNQNVTIGRNFGDKNVPKFGNNVYVGAGSVVFGEIKVGNNAIIGSNSVVNKSIPDNAIVAGNPFRVIGNTQGKTFFEIDKQVK